MTTTVIQIETPATTVVVSNDQQEIQVTGVTGPAGQGVIAGGTTGQLLAKASAADYDMAWVSGGSGGVESDPVFVAWLATVTPANWNTAYGWGNHAGLYALVGHNHSGVYEAAGAVSSHAALTTGVHGLLITAGQTLTVTTGGTLGSAAYTASGDYATSGHNHSGVYEAAGAVSSHAALTTGVHGLLITAGQTLTVTTGGTLGSAAYTASTAYATAAHTHSYLADLVADTSPQLGGDLDCNGNTVHFGTAENTQTPDGTTATIDLGAENHHTLDCGSASGAVTLTLTVPPGPCAGTLILKQGATARDVTWTPSAGAVKWLGTEPTWASDTNKYRIVAWRWNGALLFLSATETD